MVNHISLSRTDRRDLVILLGMLWYNIKCDSNCGSCEFGVYRTKESEPICAADILKNYFEKGNDTNG